MTMFGESGSGPRTPRSVWTFLSTFGFVMLCGIVGPIFLVAYFLIDEPGIEWMLWTGLGITILDVALGIGLGLMSSSGNQRSSRLRATGRAAIADITSIQQTNVEINDQPLMKLGLHIHGDDIVSFDVEKRTVVPVYQQALLHGRRLAVLVDPATNEFEIDWQGTALLSGSVPAQFTSAEDGRTYDITGQFEPLSKILAILQQHGISTAGSIDLRSNPAARDEVMSVVQSYMGGGDEKKLPRERSIGERLADLEDLKVRGAITDAEYAEARGRILGSI
ncbi:SHOCT domain-containing protein [Gordonia sp. NPDC003585]|uniref:SHOCT domain-containing protein n=1 Tax=Gordonia sp. NPDC003585 TaxID=3154275 RepID=UPI0033B42DEE